MALIVALATYSLCYFFNELLNFLGFPCNSVKNLPAMQETWVLSLGREDPLEKEMATHPVVLSWNPVDKEAWQATVHRVTRVRHILATNPPTPLNFLFSPL